MFRFAIALLFVLPSLAEATDWTGTIKDLQPGVAYKLTLGADGNPVIVPLPVVTAGPAGPTNPTDPNPPPGNTVEARAQSLTAAAMVEGGTSATAAKLSVAYSAVAEQVATGNMPLNNVAPSLKLLTDTIIPASEATKWAGWRTGIGDVITTRMGDKETAAATLRSVSTGTKRAVDGAAQVSGNAIDWGEIFKLLLPIILKLIEKWLLVPAVM